MQWSAHPTKVTTIYKALIESRTMYGLIGIENKNLFETIQIIHNKGLRIALGLTKSTPITSLLAISSELPVDLKNEIQTIKFIVKQIELETNIGTEIKHFKSLEKFNKLYEKYNEIKLLTTDTTEIIFNDKLKVQSNKIDNYTKQNTNSEALKSIYLEKISKIYYNKIYTDGSKIDNKQGIGIYDTATNITFSANIVNPTSIKNIELIAIREAILLGIKHKYHSFSILTDSLNSCMALINARNGNIFETHAINIWKIVQHCKFNINILYIPSHIGIHGNEKADEAAKDGTKTNNFIYNHLTYMDIIWKVKAQIWNEWQNRYLENTVEKGKFYREVIEGKLNKNTWFKNNTMNAKQIKIINRLKTGHSYDDKFLNLMKILTTDLCDTCNSVTNAEHIIINCRKYNAIRSKYPSLNSSSYIDLIRSNDNGNYKQICSFLNEIEKNI